MPRPSKTDQELAAIRDCWTELRTIEADYHGVVSIYVNPISRPGVFSWRMVFTPLMGNAQNLLGVQALEFQYPNVEQSMLSGFLWRKAIALGRMVREHYDMYGHAPKNKG